MKSKPNKTQATKVSVNNFIAGVANETRRKDAEWLVNALKKITGRDPIMWGPSIIGFGTCHYKYESGREGDMPAAAFSPRAASTTIYLNDGMSRYDELLKKLGPHKTSKVCLYINRLEDVDKIVLEEIIRESYAYANVHDGAMHRAL